MNQDNSPPTAHDLHIANGALRARVAALEADLLSAAHREKRLIRRYDAKLDNADAKIAQAVAALTAAEELYQTGLVNAPAGLPTRVAVLRHTFLTDLKAHAA